MKTRLSGAAAASVAGFTGLLLLALAIPAFAQPTTPDVAITIAMYEPGTLNQIRRTRVGDEVAFIAQIRNHGPGQPQNVTVHFNVPGQITSITSPVRGMTCTELPPVQCNHPSPEITALPGSIIVRSIQRTAGTFTATARVSHSVADSFPANDVSTWDFEVIGGPDLYTRVAVTRFGDAYWAQPRIEPGAPELFTLSGGNLAPTTARNVRMTASMPNGGTINALRNATPNLTCAIVANEVICTSADFDRGEVGSVEVHYAAPDRKSGGDVIIESKITSTDTDFETANNQASGALALVRHLDVANANDEGAGSLRQALLDAQEHCADAPCRIVLGDAREFRPRTPLPELRGFVTIDGQKITTIDGSEQPDGPGIRIGDGCEIRLNGFHIHGFAGHGIEVRGNRPVKARCEGRAETSAVQITNNVIGAAAPNLRGVVVDDSDSVAIRLNTISRNRRAGVFATRTRYLDVTGNQIQHNGASGVFLQTTYGADVTLNAITDNGEWGVARSGSGEVAVTGNSIARNPNPAIDHELDFETEDHFDDVRRLPNKPVLTSAFYDPLTKTTYINGRVSSANAGLSTWRVEVYANTENSRQLEQLLGGVFVAGGAGNFTLAVGQDLTDKFITSTLTRSRILGANGFARPLSHPTLTPTDTSEVSNVIPVTR